MKIRRKIVFSDSEVTDTNQLEEDAIAESVNDDINALFEVEKKELVTIESDDEPETQTAMHQEGHAALVSKVEELANSESESGGLICVVGYNSWHYLEYMLGTQQELDDLKTWQVINKKSFSKMRENSFSEYIFEIIYTYISFISKRFFKLSNSTLFLRDSRIGPIEKRICELKKKTKKVHRVIKHKKISIWEYSRQIDTLEILEIFDSLRDILRIFDHELPYRLEDFGHQKQIMHLTTHGIDYNDSDSLSAILGMARLITDMHIIVILSIDQNVDELDEEIRYKMGYTTFTVDSFLNLYSTPDKIFFV